MTPGSPGAQSELDQAFEAYLRTGQSNQDLADLAVDTTGFQAAQGTGTGAAGGYLVPDGFRQRIVDRMVAFGGIAGVAEEIVTSAGNALPWPTCDDTSNTGEIVQEGGTFAAGADITFDTKSLGAYEYAAGGASSTPLRIPWTLIQDSAFNIQQFASRKLGERIARLQATHLVTGNGAGQPLGITHGITGVELADDTAGVTYNDLINFIHSVDPAYRVGARWAFNDATLKTLEQITDSNGDPLWRSMNSTMGDAPSNGRLLAYPVTIDQAFPDIDVDNASQNWGVFGNLREGYVIRRVRGIVVVVNPYTRSAYRQTEISCWARMDATQQNTNAYIAMTGEE